MAEEGLASDVVERRESRFNAGVAKLERLDKYKINLHLARMEVDPLAMLHCLQSIKNEIYERMTPSERADCARLQATCSNIIKAGRRSKHLDAFSELEKYELFLLDIEFKYGYSMPNKNDVLDATRM